MIDSLADECKAKDAYANPELPGTFMYAAEVLAVHKQQGGCSQQAYYSGPKSLENLLMRSINTKLGSTTAKLAMKLPSTPQACE